MASKPKTTKIIVIIILFVFLLITALSAIVPYIGKDAPSATTDENISGDVTIETGVDLSGAIAL